MQGPVLPQPSTTSPPPFVSLHLSPCGPCFPESWPLPFARSYSSSDHKALRETLPDPHLRAHASGLLVGMQVPRLSSGTPAAGLEVGEHFPGQSGPLGAPGPARGCRDPTSGLGSETLSHTFTSGLSTCPPAVAALSMWLNEQRTLGVPRDFCPDTDLISALHGGAASGFPASGLPLRRESSE